MESFDSGDPGTPIVDQLSSTRMRVVKIDDLSVYNKSNLRSVSLQIAALSAGQGVNSPTMNGISSAPTSDGSCVWKANSPRYFFVRQGWWVRNGSGTPAKDCIDL